MAGIASGMSIADQGGVGMPSLGDLLKNQVDNETAEERKKRLQQQAEQQQKQQAISSSPLAQLMAMGGRIY